MGRQKQFHTSSQHPSEMTDYIYHQKNQSPWITAIQQAIEEENRSLDYYISKSREKLLKTMKMGNILKRTGTKAQYKKKQFEHKLNSWKNKPLHGQHLKNIEGKHDHNSTWVWLKLGTIKKEAEGLIFAAQEQTLQTNVMKAKIQGISANSQCQLGQEKDETVLHLISYCPKIAQITKLDMIEWQN